MQEDININDLVNEYFKVNKEEKEAKKRSKELSDKIKTYLKDNKLNKYNSTEATATLTEVVTTDYDDEKVIVLMKKLNPDLLDRILIQQIDMDAFTDLAINNEIDITNYNEAIITKKTYRLNINKNKEKEE